MTDLVTRDFIAPAADGYPLSMRLVAAAEPRIAVLVSSGTGFPKGFYERFARYLADRGAAVLTYDFRGIAGSRPEELKGSTIDYPDWGRLDMPAALDALIEAAPGLARRPCRPQRRRAFRRLHAQPRPDRAARLRLGRHRLVGRTPSPL